MRRPRPPARERSGGGRTRRRTGLLLTALVIWLSSVTGSFIASALIAGGFFAVLALLVYLFAIRDAVEQIRRQAETVYEVAHAAQTGYEWLAGKVSLFLKLREELQKK